jgi:hypothetical protein
VGELTGYEKQMLAWPDQQISGGIGLVDRWRDDRGVRYRPRATSGLKPTSGQCAAEAHGGIEKAICMPGMRLDQIPLGTKASRHDWLQVTSVPLNTPTTGLFWLSSMGDRLELALEGSRLRQRPIIWV